MGGLPPNHPTLNPPVCLWNWGGPWSIASTTWLLSLDVSSPESPHIHHGCSAASNDWKARLLSRISLGPTESPAPSPQQTPPMSGFLPPWLPKLCYTWLGVFCHLPQGSCKLITVSWNASHWWHPSSLVFTSRFWDCCMTSFGSLATAAISSHLDNSSTEHVPLRFHVPHYYSSKHNWSSARGWSWRPAGGFASRPSQFVWVCLVCLAFSPAMWVSKTCLLTWP